MKLGGLADQISVGQDSSLENKVRVVVVLRLKSAGQASRLEI